MRALSSLFLLLALACGERDGVVGVQPVADGVTSPSGGFLDELETNDGRWQPQEVLPGASAVIGAPNDAARDGYLAELRFPGHPDYAAGDNVGPDYATQLATRERFHFGTYRTRLAFGSCAASEDAVMAFFGFFNDGSDADGDGIVDDLEINVQVLCSDPSKLYLTVFTDYEEQPTRRFRKLSRLIDFDTGEQFDTPGSESDTFELVGSSAALALPAPFADGQLQELGFAWHADELRFFLSVDGVDRELWTLSGRERVPQRPVYVMYNLWHPEAHWSPPQETADFPANDVWLRVDWVSFTPE